MNTPRLALAALLSALAAGISFAQPLAQPLTPIINGPAGPGQCLVGMDSCGAGPGFSMDPATEGALVGLGEPMTPAGAAANALPPAKAAAKSEKAGSPPAPDETDAVAAMGVGIGGIINPPGGLGIAKVSSAAQAGPATLGAALGVGDAGGIDASAPPPASAGPFSFRKVQKAAAAASLMEKEVPPPDAKLTPDDANLAPGTTRASSNGR